jgi:hypothetical protein
MTADIDIYRTANQLMKQWGAFEAEIEAAQRADAFLESGDMEGRSVWLRIMEAVRELSAAGPAPDGHTVH